MLVMPEILKPRFIPGHEILRVPPEGKIVGVANAFNYEFPTDEAAIRAAAESPMIDWTVYVDLGLRMNGKLDYKGKGEEFLLVLDDREVRMPHSGTESFYYAWGGPIAVDPSYHHILNLICASENDGDKRSIYAKQSLSLALPKSVSKSKKSRLISPKLVVALRASRTKDVEHVVETYMELKKEAEGILEKVVNGPEVVAK